MSMEELKNARFWLSAKTNSKCPMCGRQAFEMNDKAHMTPTVTEDGAPGVELMSIMIECSHCKFQMFFDYKIVLAKDIHSIFTSERTTVRIERAFEHLEIKTIGDLLRLGKKRLAMLHNFGKDSVRTVERIVDEAGYVFTNEMKKS